MRLWSLVVLLLGAAASLVFLLAGRGRRLASSRVGRLARVGRLSARLSASFLGASLRRAFARGERRARIDEARRRADAARVAETMGQMKGAFMKLGQMLSFVTDAVPPEYRAALAQLQAQAPPMDFPLVRAVAEDELGRPLERAFARFDAVPLAAASIGQVHRAKLPSGQEVAVKIQYPGVADAIRGDLANVAILYRMVGLIYPAVEPGPVVEELRERVTEELDYAREAKNQRAFAEMYEGHPFIRIPGVLEELSTERVLVTEYVPGLRFGQVLGQSEAERSRWGEILYRFVFGSIIRFGVFNGDPHPGNYLFDEAGRMVFLDFGCVKYFPEPMLHGWDGIIAAHLRGDRQAFREGVVRLGFMAEGAPIDTDDLYDYFAYFYAPIHDDGEFVFAPEYNARSLAMVFNPSGRFAKMKSHGNMPRDFVFVNRIQWGVYSILAELRARGNWHRIHRELHGELPPSTELGRLEAAWRARWAAARGLEGMPLKLTPEGIRPRDSVAAAARAAR